MAETIAPIGWGTGGSSSALAELMNGVANGGAANSAAAGNSSAAWLDRASGTMLDLGTGDGELLRFLSSELKDASPAEQIALQQLSEQRNRIIGALTQIIRSIGETARQIIGNIR